MRGHRWRRRRPVHPSPSSSMSLKYDNYFTELCSGSEEGSYLRFIDSFITQLKAQGPSRTCTESKEEEEEVRYTLNPQPSTLNPQPSTLNPQPSTPNPQPSTLKVSGDDARLLERARAPQVAVRPDRPHPPRRQRQGVRNVQWFRGGLVLEVDRLLYHSA